MPPELPDDLLDQLFGSPFDRFTEVRKELARGLKARGERAAAADLDAVKRPTRGAWAMNQIARRHPGELNAFVAAAEKAGETLKKAVGGRDFSAVRAAGTAMNEAVAKLSTLAGQIIEADGGKMSDAVAHAIAGTLRAIPLLPADQMERVTRGTLVLDLEPPDELSVFGVPPPAEEAPAPAAADSTAIDKAKQREESRRKEEAAKKRARELESLEKVARDAESEAARRERAAEGAAAHAHRLEEEARAARLAAERARSAVEDARRK
jgi:hypothetical protein